MAKRQIRWAFEDFTEMGFWLERGEPFDFGRLDDALEGFKNGMESVESDRVREALGKVYCAMADFAQIAKEEGL